MLSRYINLVQLVKLHTTANTKSQHWHLLHMVSVYVACALNSFYYFGIVITRETFGLPAVVFLESSIMPTDD